MAKRLKPCPACGGTLEHLARCVVTRAANAHQVLLHNEKRDRRARNRLIREARKAGVSQLILAEALGVTKHAVQLIEQES